MLEAYRVRRGARYLDEVYEGWEDIINIEELDIVSGTLCPLGQIFGAYIRGLNELGLGYKEEIKYGFVPGLLSGSFCKLTEYWIKEAEYRRDYKYAI